MAITNAEARAKYLGPVRDAYASALIFRQLTNRRFEGDAADAYTLNLNTTTASFSPTETDRSTTRNPTLPQAQTSDHASDKLQMQYVAQQSIYEANLDLLEGPPDMMPVIMREATYSMAAKADDRIRAILLAGIANANDGEDTAGLRRGDATNYVDSNGQASTATARSYFSDLIRLINHTYRAKNFWKLGDPAYDERTPIIITDNAMGTSMLEYIDKDKPSDNLVDTYTRSDGVTVGGAFGVWKDIPIFLTNRLPLLAISSKDYHQILVTNAAAITAAFRAPEIAIDQGSILVNVAGTLTKLFGWTMDAQAVYGATVVNPDLLFRYVVRAEA